MGFAAGRKIFGQNLQVICAVWSLALRKRQKGVKGVEIGPAPDVTSQYALYIKVRNQRLTSPLIWFLLNQMNRKKKGDSLCAVPRSLSSSFDSHP